MPTRNIGITGFMSVEELRTMQSHFLGVRTDRSRFMNGILVSQKTMGHITNKYPGRYPWPERYRELFNAANTPDTLALCHYATDTPENLLTECEQIIELAGPGLQGFQLNADWPDPAIVKELTDRHPGLHIVIQVKRPTEPEMLARVKAYGDTIRGVILDSSGGNGTELVVSTLVEPLKALMALPHLEITAAGGNRAETVGRLSPLRKICPYVGHDAERLLFPDNHSPLDMQKAKDYLSASFTF